MKFFVVTIFLLCSTSLFASEVTFLLVRHGETDWNVERRVQGQTNNPLNKRGVAQAQAVTEKLIKEHPDIAAIYSSDLSRAYDTGVELSKRLGIPIRKCVSLREINTGVSEGMTVAEKEALYGSKHRELNEKYPDRKIRWDYSSVPGEETLNQLVCRIKQQLVAIAKSEPNGTVAIFSHGKAIRATVADITDSDIETVSIANTAIVEVIYNEGRFRLGTVATP